MYPHERSLVEELEGKPFALIGVNSDKLARAKKAIAEKKLNWRSFQNQPEGAETKISSAWSIKGWPTIVILDETMKIHYRGHNGHEATEVARKLLAALEAKNEKR